MQIQITHATSEYRGDHTADLSIAIAAKPDESIKSLVTRVLALPTMVVRNQNNRVSQRKQRFDEHIELRIMKEEGSTNEAYHLESIDTDEEDAMTQKENDKQISNANWVLKCVLLLQANHMTEEGITEAIAKQFEIHKRSSL